MDWTSIITVLISTVLGSSGAYAVLLAHRAQIKREAAADRIQEFNRLDGREQDLWVRIQTVLEVERQRVEILRREIEILEQKSAKEQAELRAQIYELESQNMALRRDLSEVQASALEYSKQLENYQRLEKELREEINELRKVQEGR